MNLAAKLNDLPAPRPTKLTARAAALLRTAYDALQSAGGLLLTAGNVSADPRALDAIRRTMDDAAADISVAAYKLGQPPACDQLIDDDVREIALSLGDFT